MRLDPCRPANAVSRPTPPCLVENLGPRVVRLDEPTQTLSEWDAAHPNPSGFPLELDIIGGGYCAVFLSARERLP